jgi:hypothetical protein
MLIGSTQEYDNTTGNVKRFWNLHTILVYSILCVVSYDISILIKFQDSMCEDKSKD